MTNIQQWLIGALVSHDVIDVVDFKLCEIENATLDESASLCSLSMLYHMVRRPFLPSSGGSSAYKRRRPTPNTRGWLLRTQTQKDRPRDEMTPKDRRTGGARGRIPAFKPRLS
jgi:hypothetical protein